MTKPLFFSLRLFSPGSDHQLDLLGTHAPIQHFAFELYFLAVAEVLTDLLDDGRNHGGNQADQNDPGAVPLHCLAVRPGLSRAAA